MEYPGTLLAYLFVYCCFPSRLGKVVSGAELSTCFLLRPRPFPTGFPFGGDGRGGDHGNALLPHLTSQNKDLKDLKKCPGLVASVTSTLQLDAGVPRMHREVLSHTRLLGPN